MKRLINLSICFIALSATSQAATVLIATGLGGTSLQGVTLETSLDHTQLVSSAGYYVSVGRFSAGVFTPWVGTSAVVDTATGTPTSEVSGSFSTSTGAAFDGLQIHVFFGLISTVATDPALAFTPSGTAWAVLTQTTSSLFTPSSGSGSTTVNLTTPGILSIVAVGDAANSFNGTSNVSGSATNYFYLAIPEPSSIMLGALGVLALLRRRR